MDKIYEQTMLFDFYGELLTEHQRSIYEDAVYNDMSLGEIAEERGISRQGVHDLIRRCDKILQGYERKLHLVERFVKTKETVLEIKRLSDMAGLNGSTTDADYDIEENVLKDQVLQDNILQDNALQDKVLKDKVLHDSVSTLADIIARMHRISSLAQGLMEEL